MPKLTKEQAKELRSKWNKWDVFVEKMKAKDGETNKRQYKLEKFGVHTNNNTEQFADLYGEFGYEGNEKIVYSTCQLNKLDGHRDIWSVTTITSCVLKDESKREDDIEWHTNIKQDINFNKNSEDDLFFRMDEIVNQYVQDVWNAQCNDEDIDDEYFDEDDIEED